MFHGISSFASGPQRFSRSMERTCPTKPDPAAHADGYAPWQVSPIALICGSTFFARSEDTWSISRRWRGAEAPAFTTGVERPMSNIAKRADERSNVVARQFVGN